MSKKILEYFRGDRKYFAIVFFILVMIFVVGLVTPVLIENKKDNWNEELSNKIIGIENGIKSILSEKESQLVSTKDQIKIELRNSLNVTDYEYGKLNSLVNRNDYKNYSLEIVAPNGKIIAWNSSPAIEQEEIFPFVYPINETHFFNSPLITYLSIIDTVILHSDRFYLLLSQPIEKHYSLQNKYYTEISLSDALSDKFNTLVDVFFDPYAAAPKDGRMHSVILLNSENLIHLDI